MALNATLNLRQSQSLVMTPQLLQSIRLLQYTSLELSRYIDEQVERNPLLERDTGEPAERRGEGSATADSDIVSPSAPTDTADLEGMAASVSEKSMEDTFDTSAADLYPDDAPAMASTAGPGLSSRDPALPSSGGEVSDFGIEDYAATKRTLREQVSDQLGMLV